MFELYVAQVAHFISNLLLDILLMHEYIYLSDNLSYHEPSEVDALKVAYGRRPKMKIYALILRF